MLFVRGLAGIIETLAVKGVLRVSKRKLVPQVSEGSEFLLGHEIALVEGGAGEPVYVSKEERRKHLYAIGSTGCGKTSLLLRLIEDEVKHGRTLVVMDLRGDLVDRILTRLAHQKRETPSISLLDLREDDYHLPFNPLAGLDDLYSRSLHLLEVIRKGSDSWGIQLEETLRNCLIALASSGQSLVDIERLLDNSSFREQIISNCSDEHVRSFFERYGRLSAERQQSWSLPVLNKVTPLLSIPQLRRMLGSAKGFEWPSVLDKPGHLFLIALAAHRFHGASHLLGGLLVSSLQSAVMARASISETQRNPVTLFVDEFETMATPSFGAIIAEGRRFGLSLVLTHQNLAQLDPVLRQAIRNNVYVQLFFQTGSLDAGDLVNDLIAGESRDALRQALIRQKVGEAFFVRRGEPSIHFSALHMPDPRIEPSRLADVKRQILQSCCARAKAPDEVKAQQEHSLARTQMSTEVRHDKRPRTKRAL